MKKFLCMLMALVMALGCTAAFAEADLQAQLDAANAKIAELQAKVDAYYPYYFAQIVATYGEDGVIWLDDMQAQYEAMQAQYAGYGIDLEAMGMADSAKKTIVDGAVEEAVLLAKAKELGLDQFDEETLTKYEANAQEVMAYYYDSYVDYYFADAEEVTDEMRAEAEAYWAGNGYTIESTIDSYKTSEILNRVEAHATQDVSFTEEDVQAAYAALIEENKADYADDATYNSARNNGAPIAWNPEGYRAVKHVLVKFNEEQAALASQLQAQLKSLNAEKEAIQNPVEETAETEEAAAEPRSIEAVNADIAACATEMEALYSQLLPRAEEVIKKFNEGTPFADLIAEYNEDPGMFREPIASIGYAVKADSTTWDPAFTAGAMSIAEIGSISEPVYGKNGIHIIYYAEDVPAGEVALEDIREDVEANAYDASYKAAFAGQKAAWMEEMNVQYHYSNFGIAG